MEIRGAKFSTVTEICSALRVGYRAYHLVEGTLDRFSPVPSIFKRSDLRVILLSASARNNALYVD
jgi:hypothetical protein